MVLVQATVHRLTVCTFDLQKHQKRGGFRKAPSTSEGSTLREPRARQGNGFPAHTLPSTDRQRTPSRCCASHPAYAPTTTSPARYRAGRAKQHNHARNVKPLPPRRSPGRTLPGQEGGGQCPLPCPANLSVLLTLPCPGALSLSFHLLPGRTCPQALACSLPFGKKRKNPRSSMRCCLNQYCGLHLLSPYPRLLPSCARPVLGVSFLSAFFSPPVLAFLLVPLPDRK